MGLGAFMKNYQSGYDWQQRADERNRKRGIREEAGQAYEESAIPTLEDTEVSVEVAAQNEDFRDETTGALPPEAIETEKSTKKASTKMDWDGYTDRLRKIYLSNGDFEAGSKAVAMVSEQRRAKFNEQFMGALRAFQMGNPEKASAQMNNLKDYLPGFPDMEFTVKDDEPGTIIGKQEVNGKTVEFEVTDTWLTKLYGASQDPKTWMAVNQWVTEEARKNKKADREEDKFEWDKSLRPLEEKIKKAEALIKDAQAGNYEEKFRGEMDFLKARTAAQKQLGRLRDARAKRAAAAASGGLKPPEIRQRDQDVRAYVKTRADVARQISQKRAEYHATYGDDVTKDPAMVKALKDLETNSGLTPAARKLYEAGMGDKLAADTATLSSRFPSVVNVAAFAREVEQRATAGWALEPNPETGALRWARQDPDTKGKEVTKDIRGSEPKRPGLPDEAETISDRKELDDEDF